MTPESKPVEGEAGHSGANAQDDLGYQGGSSPLSAASAAGSPPAPSHAFDQEFNRLNDALVSHSPQSFRSSSPAESHDEKELEGWMQRVDKTLSKLRKRRSKRGNARR